jgi:hypothetical protein
MKCLLQQLILSFGAAFLARSPRRTTRVRLCRPRLREAYGGLRSKLPRYGIYEYSELLHVRP